MKSSGRTKTRSRSITPKASKRVSAKKGAKRATRGATSVKGVKSAKSKESKRSGGSPVSARSTKSARGSGSAKGRSNRPRNGGSSRKNAPAMTAGSVSEGPGLGAMAPGFDLETGDGRRVSLSDFAGKTHVVLYFYPKDMTSGCTIEACAFRDSIGKVRSVGAEILGVSMDSPALHKKFADKYSLPFPLLADTSGDVSRAYGVYKEKSMYGRKFWGIERSTFVIDRAGRIRKLWRKVKVNGHDRDVLSALAEI